MKPIKVRNSLLLTRVEYYFLCEMFCVLCVRFVCCVGYTVFVRCVRQVRSDVPIVSEDVASRGVAACRRSGVSGFH